MKNYVPPLKGKVSNTLFIDEYKFWIQNNLIYKI